MVDTCFVKLVRECPVRESVNNTQLEYMYSCIYYVEHSCHSPKEILLYTCLAKELPSVGEAVMNIHILAFPYQLF